MLYVILKADYIESILFILICFYSVIFLLSTWKIVNFRFWEVTIRYCDKWKA